MSARQPLASGQNLAAACGLLGVALLGWVNLPIPFTGDQALFLDTAKKLNGGGTLYLTVWDNKQPGIYWFYELGGRVFGFSEIGVRLFELCYLMLGALLLVWLSRRWLSNGFIASLAPLATFGAYYAGAGPWHLTQLEILVTPLLLLMVGLVAFDGGPIPVKNFLFGVATALVMLFKLVLVPIPAAIWLADTWRVYHEDHEGLASIGKHRLLPLFFGACAVLVPVVAVFWHAGALDEFAWATFVYPARALGEIPSAPLGRLTTGLRWFGWMMAPWMAFAVMAAVFCPAHPSRITRSMLLWITVAIVVILVQKFSWWQYHFNLLFVPAGALGVRGLDRLATRIAAPGRRLIMAGVAAAAALSPTVAEAAVKANRWRAVDFTLDPTGLVPYRAARNAAYGDLPAELRLLDAPEALPGTIYVLGNPLYVLYSGRVVAIPLHGWSWEMFLHSQVEAAQKELEAAAPAYVLVSRLYARRLDSDYPATAEWLRSRYDPAVEVFDGVWYRRRETQ
jgi:hypothetical protein